MIRKSQRFASPFKFSADSKVFFFLFRVLISNLKNDLSNCETLARPRSTREYNDTPWSPLLFHSRNRSTTGNDVSTILAELCEIRNRCIVVDGSNSKDAFRSLYFHTVFRPLLLLLFIYRCCHCCYNCSLTSFSQILIHALGVSRKMKRIFFVRYESIVLSTSLNFN